MTGRVDLADRADLWEAFTSVATSLTALLPSIARQDRGPVLDPRTGQDALPTPRWLPALTIGVPLVSLTVAVALALVLGALVLGGRA